MFSAQMILARVLSPNTLNPRIETQRYRVLNGRRHKKLPQIGSENLYRALLSVRRKLRANLALNGRKDQPLEAVLARRADELAALGVVHGELPHAHTLALALGETDRYLELPLLFAAVERQRLVTRQSAYRSAELEIVFVDLVGILGGGGRIYRALAEDQPAQLFAELRAVGKILGNDVHRSLNSVLSRFNALFRVDERRGFRFGNGIGILLQKYLRERLEPLFPCDRAARLALGLERAVDILHLHKRHRLLDSRRDLVRHLLLLGDRRGDLLLALFKIAQIRQPVEKLAQHGIVQRARLFLSITRDERYRLVVVDKGDGIVDLLLPQVEFFCQSLIDIHFTPRNSSNNPYNLIIAHNKKIFKYILFFNTKYAIINILP